jgi:protocatechuate 3,4-dioxygenase beta subunit
LTPGTFHFRVMADGFAPFDVKDVVVKSGELTPGLSFRLEASTRVAGKVVEAGTDRPIVGARIEFVSLDAVEMGIRDPGAPTRSDGTFELEAPPDGRGRLHASHSLYTEARTEAFDLRRGERVVIPTIELGRGGSATGIAIDRSGAIAARARVDAYFSGQVNPYPRNAYRDVRSDAKGSFRIEGLIAGEWTVMVHPDGNYEGLNGENTTVSGKVTIVDGQTSVVTFKRPKGGGCTVYGRVTRGGNPLTNGHINLWRDSNGSSASLDADENQASTQLGSQGQYKFSNLTPGPAQIYVSTWGDESSSFSKSIEIPEAAEYKFDIEMPAGGEIRGRVTSRATGKPIVGIDIHAYGVPEGGAPGSSTQSNATTDSDGRYSLKGLATGSVQVNAGPEPGISRASADTKKFMRSYAQVKVTEGTTVTHDFVLDEGASVVVEVVDENGKPVADAWVQVNPLTPSAGWGGAYASSNELGVATIHGVAPGKARAYCQVQGYPPVNSAEFDAALNSTARTRIALVRGVDIVLRILGPDGALLQPFWISLHGEGGVDGGSAHRGNPGQPADGSLKLTVVPGAYKAQIGLADMQNAQADVNIGSKSGSTIDVKLEKLPEKLEKKK